VIQIALAFLSAFVIIVAIDSIAYGIADFIVRLYHIEPKLPLILPIVRDVLKYYAMILFLFWAVFHGHAVYVIESNCKLMSETQPVPSCPFLLTLPFVEAEANPRIKYEHPTLHGQSARIPVYCQ